jgi:hypothetical protein
VSADTVAAAFTASTAGELFSVTLAASTAIIAASDLPASAGTDGSQTSSVVVTFSNVMFLGPTSGAVAASPTPSGLCTGAASTIADVVGTGSLTAGPLASLLAPNKVT